MGETLLGIGFIFSLLTLILLAIIWGVVIAIFTFVISIILRGIGWISISNRSMYGRFKLVGILVLVLGVIFVITILPLFPVIEEAVGYGSFSVFIPFSFWIIYSLAEWTTYIKIGSAGKKLMYGSTVSIIGIIMLVITLYYLSTVGIGAAIVFPILYYSILIPLMISSLIAAIGFFTLNVEELNL